MEELLSQIEQDVRGYCLVLSCVLVIGIFLLPLVAIPVVISRPSQTVICVDAQSALHLREPALKVMFNPSLFLQPILSVTYMLLLQQTHCLVNFLIV